MNKFKLKSDFKPGGDQPTAIAQLTDGLNEGLNHQTLLGVTGSGKTFSMANVIQNAETKAAFINALKSLVAELDEK